MGMMWEDEYADEIVRVLRHRKFEQQSPPAPGGEGRLGSTILLSVGVGKPLGACVGPGRTPDLGR
jgi:hypothetical protein